MKHCASLAAVAVLLVAGPASAQSPTVQTKDYVDRTIAGDRVVTFSTDDLQASGPSAYGTSIRVVPGVLRQGLIRPRMNFVSELLKTVENL